MNDEVQHYTDLEEWVAELRRRRDLGHQIFWADHPKAEWVDGEFVVTSTMAFVDADDETSHDILLSDAYQGAQRNPDLRGLIGSVEGRRKLLQPGV